MKVIRPILFNDDNPMDADLILRTFMQRELAIQLHVRERVSHDVP
jgi:hypothetical protein